ncbi:MAG: Trm112 family protein [Candidatus Brocadiae bacterium]|nr:Trm112 family protein [Candidatus Brocadiia bacterium]
MGEKNAKERSAASEIDEELLSLLACPACREPVEKRRGLLVCRGCGLGYPIKDGIPVMLIDEAVPPGQDAPGPADPPPESP